MRCWTVTSASRPTNRPHHQRSAAPLSPSIMLCGTTSRTPVSGLPRETCHNCQGFRRISRTSARERGSRGRSCGDRQRVRKDTRPSLSGHRSKWRLGECRDEGCREPRHYQCCAAHGRHLVDLATAHVSPAQLRATVLGALARGWERAVEILPATVPLDEHVFVQRMAGHFRAWRPMPGLVGGLC